MILLLILQRIDTKSYLFLQQLAVISFLYYYCGYSLYQTDHHGKARQQRYQA